ncbi:chloride channel [Coniella lustricola]|uniref:Chloride channel protein n=1 Tax=Coniella lustricola TaxID=2025994 RepID=A0A2T3AFI8_9PEZI|nr:chloride channel [Coniella lustricola]
MNIHSLDSSEASSSSYSTLGQAQATNRDENNHSRSLADDDSNEDELAGEDPLHHGLDAPISFKRKQKRTLLDYAQPSRLFQSLTGSDARSSGGHRPDIYNSIPTGDGQISEDETGGSPLRRRAGANGNASAAKDGGPLDWYVEGPGRRVGYEDLTAIDWIFEYTQERTRLRVLRSSAKGLMGKLQLALDTAQEWMILVLTGILVGTLAATIDITTGWLADLKFGYCTNTDGGSFYLNKSFCCLGYDEGAQCLGWRPWAHALHISSAAGGFMMEYLLFAMFSVFFAFCASILVKEYAVHAKHSGIPEIKTVLGGFVIRRFLGAWTLMTKSLGLCLAVASSMWLGKEGPLVHVACCCANLFVKLFPVINENEARKREVLSAAAASGISVAFGSPIGGVLFSLEQISYYFPDKTMWKSFVCASVAAVILKALDPFRTGETALYHVKYDTEWHAFEFGPFVLMGIIGGIYGGLFIRMNMKLAQWKKSSNLVPGPVTQVVVVAILTALVNYPNLYMRAQNSELVSNLFAECSKLGDDQFGLCKTGAASASTIVLLLFAAVLGSLLANLTFGLQIPAGIILPSMAIGALSGRAVGIIMEIWVSNHPEFYPFAHQCAPDVPCINPGTYAIIGAAAALAGVTRMTVSIVVIMFELTGALTYVLPIMIAVMISKWTGDAISRRGIYESWIHLNEYPFLDNTDDNLQTIPDIPSAQIMTRIEDLVVLTATGHTMASLRAILDAHTYRGFPVISDPREAVLLGYISRAELSYNLSTAAQILPPETEAFFSHQPLADPRTTLDLRPWMDQTPITLPSMTSLHLAVTYFQKLGLRYVLFSDRGALQGLLTKKDVWYVLNGAEETRRTAGTPGNFGVETGITREDGEGEQRGLLSDRHGIMLDDEPSPNVEVASIL